MQTNKASLSLLGVLVIAALLVVGILKSQQVYAQADATSTESVGSVEPVDTVAASSTEEVVVDEPTETEPPTGIVADAAISDTPVTETQTASTAESSSSSVTPTEAPPEGLTEVHIIGTKYIDYFTDGTTATAYPGDPAIDGNLDQPNAPIPTHEGLTWDHTTGGTLYDTASGDLEVGQYALKLNGSYIVNEPPGPPFISSTSTPAVLGESTSSEVTPPDTSSTSTTTAEPTDTADSTTTPTPIQ